MVRLLVLIAGLANGLGATTGERMPDNSTCIAFWEPDHQIQDNRRHDLFELLRAGREGDFSAQFKLLLEVIPEPNQYAIVEFAQVLVPYASMDNNVGLDLLRNQALQDQDIPAGNHALVIAVSDEAMWYCSQFKLTDTGEINGKISFLNGVELGVIEKSSVQYKEAELNAYNNLRKRFEDAVSQEMPDDILTFGSDHYSSVTAVTLYDGKKVRFSGGINIGFEYDEWFMRDLARADHLGATLGIELLEIANEARNILRGLEEENE